MSIQRADPQERRKLILIVVVMALLGGLAILWVQGQLGAMQTQIAGGQVDLALAQFTTMVSVALALLVLTGSALAAMVAVGARRVIREQRYPHSGTRLIRDVEVRQGAAAVRIGRLGLALACVIALSTAIGSVLAWRLLIKFDY